jgi:hypothetical protein
MTIKSTVVFVTKGRQFPTVQKALDFREGLVEAFMRECPGFQDIPGKQRIAFVTHVLENRNVLRDLLDYTALPLVDD